jgi:hypothetical protein
LPVAIELGPVRLAFQTVSIQVEKLRSMKASWGEGWMVKLLSVARWSAGVLSYLLLLTLCF